MYFVVFLETSSTSFKSVALALHGNVIDCNKLLLSSKITLKLVNTKPYKSWVQLYIIEYIFDYISMMSEKRSFT